jgi:hypothetical protein
MGLIMGLSAWWFGTMELYDFPYVWEYIFRGVG